MQLSGVTALLSVFDMPTARAFYCDLLGFSVTAEAPAWCTLQLGGATLMLNTAYDEGERPLVPDAARIAAHADTYLYFASRDVDAIYELLRAHTSVAAPTVAPYGMKQLFVTDPDGYSLVFQHPVA